MGITFNLYRNADGSLDGRYPAGDKPVLVPTVTGFTGSFGQGNTITLDVAGVTTKNVTQLVFATGDSAQNGADATSILPSQPVANASNYKHSTAQSFMGSGASLLAQMQAGASGSTDPYIDLGSPQDAVYFSSVMDVNIIQAGLNSEGQQLKLQRLNADTGHSGEPVIASTLFMGTDDTNVTSNNPDLFATGKQTANASNYDYALNGFGNWKRTQLYWKASDLDTPNGSYWWLEHDERDGTTYHGGIEWNDKSFNDPDEVLAGDNPAFFTPSPVWIPKLNHVTRSVSDSAAQNIQKVWLPFFKRNSSKIDLYIDGIYINNSLERIELGNAPTYEACTKRVVQEQTSRASSAIAFKCYEANFSASDNVYAFVFNQDGVYSAGHLIRSGA